MIYQKKLIKYGNSLCLIIPNELVHGLGWRPTDTIVLVPEALDKVTLRHVTDDKLLKFLEEQDTVINA